MANDGFGKGDWQLLDKKALYDGYFQLVQYQCRHRLFAGGWSAPLTREVFERGHASVAIPYDPRTDELILIEQFRVGALDTTEQPWLIELVAGIIDPGETPENVARRETLEETGLVAKRCEKVMSYLSSPGGSTERIHLYVVEVDAREAKELCGLEEEGEDIRVFTIPRTEALDWIENGKIDNGATIIGIQWLALNHQRLMDSWR